MRLRLADEESWGFYYSIGTCCVANTTKWILEVTMRGAPNEREGQDGVKALGRGVDESQW